MVDWSMLHCDILGYIVLKLEDIVDCVHFSAVCHSFKHAYMMVKEMSQLRSVPWLFLAETTEENPECFRNLFSLSTKKCYQLSLPETFGRRCWGSSYGWIVTVGLDFEMHLFNPLTKVRISLPCQSTLPTFDKGNKSWWLRKCYVNKAIVLRIAEEYVVMVAYDNSRAAFARLGDEVWTPIQGLKFDYMMFIDDFCYWDGKILIIYSNGRLGYCDINSSTPHVRDLLPAPHSVRGSKCKSLTQNKLYLVNSNDELLIVRRYKVEFTEEESFEDDDSGNEEEHEYMAEDLDRDVPYYGAGEELVSYKTIDFAVFKPNFHSKSWTEIDDVGDVALFVGVGHSISRNTLNSRNCLRNRIYFTDDEVAFWSLPINCGGHDMGSFHIGDRNNDIISFYDGSDILSTFCTPFWFVPMI